MNGRPKVRRRAPIPVAHPKNMKREQKKEKASILVIDDDSLVLKTLKHLLEKQGYFVDTAADGYEGIKKAKSGFFHLILCDIRMPGLDGIMTIRHIRDFQKQAGAEKSGVIVITAYDSQETRRSIFQLGVTDFILKPFDISRFLELVDCNLQPLLRQMPAEKVEQYTQRLKRLLTVFDSQTHPQPNKISGHST